MIDTWTADLPHGITLSCRSAGARGRPGSTRVTPPNARGTSRTTVVGLAAARLRPTLRLRGDCVNEA